MNITVEEKPAATMFRVEGSLLMGKNKRFEEAVLARLQNTRNVVLDLRLVDLIDSSGIGSLALVLGEVGKRGGSLFLSDLQPLLRNVFHRTRMDRHFKFLSENEIAEMLRD